MKSCLRVKKIPWVLIGLSFLMLGCANQGAPSRVAAENESFLVVNLRANDTYESLAKEFMGTPKYASIIQRYNPQMAIENSHYIAVPKRSLNAAGVFANGYQKVPILCYHQFTLDALSRNKMVVTQSEFKAQMQYLSDHNYQVITLSEFTEFMHSKRELPEKSVVITIDDGYKSFQDIALPILKKHQFPSTMFIYPDFVGAGVALSWQDVKTLLKEPLVDIQSHSTSHDSLSRRPSGESQDDYITRLKSEVIDAQKTIKRRAGHVVTQFAYPYGNTSETLIKMLEGANYDIAVTVQRGSNPAFSSPFLVNRTMIYGGDNLSKFRKSLDVFVSMDLK